MNSTTLRATFPRWLCAVTITTALAFLLLASPARAGVLSSADVLSRTGMSITQWGAAWWQWAFSNPDVLDDATGRFGALGDVGGPVFFAEGSGGGTLQQNYAIPGGQFVLLPVATYIWTIFDDGSGICADIVCAREIVNHNYIDGVTNLFALIDGTPVTDFASHLVRVDAGNPLIFQVDTGIPFVPGQYSGVVDAVQGGYWLMLEPLSAGLHQISFGGTAPNINGDTGELQPGTTDFKTELNTAVPAPTTYLLLCSGLAMLVVMRRSRRTCDVAPLHGAPTT